ncbi:MAG: hypothetical protein KBS81_01750 [Spirochaetales bacterium]|nr:hypothetical protein [Candidatus Physcosoma equi]
MEDTNALECFMALLDENQRILDKDYLGEASDILEYQVKEKEKKAEAPLQRTGASFASAISRPVTPPPASGVQRAPEMPMEEDISSCHKCRASTNSSIYAEPIQNPSPRILFVAPSPEGPSILDPASYDYFIKWINSIGLRRKDIALTTLIKCPVPEFDRGAADACRTHLRSEMASLKPGAMVLLGQDTASYMLRRQGDFQTVFRQKRFTVNNIPVFCTYTPHQLYLDRSLRGPVWQDLQFIASSIGLEVKK